MRRASFTAIPTGFATFIVCGLAAMQALAQPVCATGANTARLQDAMAQARFIAYQPTELQIVEGRPTPASRSSIAEDLKVLRERFDGLITYGSHSGGEWVADVAGTLNYKAVVLGIWDVAEAREVSNAIAAWRRNPSLVVGLSLGNEVVFAKRGDFPALAQRLINLRAAAPGLPIATTEPFHLWYQAPARTVLKEMDFMLVNVHPIFQPWFKTASDRAAAEFVVNVGNELAERFCGPILIKETGVPTAPAAAGFTAERQASFYAELQRRVPASRNLSFAFFSAFDAPWRSADAHPTPGPHPEEAHFGLYDADRRPKAVVAVIPPLEFK